ncbi:MAG: hypothetical protein WC315_00160 [Candidatus Omnitrophota bacterium]|jgi:hypothetical protein
MTKDLIAKFVREYNGSDLPGDLFTYLTKMEGIKETRRKLEKERCQIDASYHKAKEEWALRLRALQATCPHPETAFCGDPAGGHDSYYICTYCEKVL